MKKTLWWVGGFCAAAAGFLVLGARRVQPVEALTQAREEEWSDGTPAAGEEVASGISALGV
jgi:hypothetical protein